MSAQNLGTGAEVAAAWDDLRAALAEHPEWHLKAGFYIPNGGGWGCHLEHPKIVGIHVWVRSGTVADCFTRAAKYVRGELKQYVNDHQE